MNKQKRIIFLSSLLNMLSELLCTGTCNVFPATSRALSFLSLWLLWEKQGATEVLNHIPGRGCWAMLFFKSNAWHKQEARDTTARLGISEKPDISQACSIQTELISTGMMWEKDKTVLSTQRKGKVSEGGFFPAISQFNSISTLMPAKDKPASGFGTF